MRTCVALLLASVLLVACERDSSPTAPEDTPLDLVTVLKTPWSGFVASVRTTARTPDEWAQTWQALHAGQNPVPPLPPIDFAREMVAVAATGTRSNGCFGVEITAASLRGGETPEFEVTETVPGPSCICTQALTQPVHAVKVARVPGRARFVERRARLAC